MSPAGRYLVILASLLSAAVAVPQGHQHLQGQETARLQWILVWSDEFNHPDGSMPDPSKWTVAKGGSGFGNRELQYYTDCPTNVHLANGNLVITARSEAYVGIDGVSRTYTSARLETAGHFQQEYGRFEARIKLPQGRGIWPAF